MKRTLLPTTLLVAAALLATCGASSVTADAAAPRAFPVSVSTSAGKVVIPARPTRILSLSASATQMLYAIGAGSQVIGVDKYSTYPANAPRTSFTGYETSAEDYVPKHPDLVLLAYDTSHLVAQLQKLHIPALVLGPATTVASAQAEITEIGVATGHLAAARSENASLAATISKIVAPLGSAAKGATYYIEFDPTYYSATSKSFPGALLGRLGMVNIADPAGKGSAFPQLSAEFIVKANPDYVFLADSVCCGQSATTFAKRPDFALLRAVKEHHVIAVNDSLASQWGPHAMEGFLQLAANSVKHQASSTSSS